jgi:hypothetical protein
MNFFESFEENRFTACENYELNENERKYVRIISFCCGSRVLLPNEISNFMTENLEQEEKTAQALESNMPILLEKAKTTASKSARM